MNCKKDDLAVITRGSNAGLFVTCLELVENNQNGDYKFSGSSENVPIWKIDKCVPCQLTDGRIRMLPYIDDKSLMPIPPEELNPEPADFVIQEIFSDKSQNPSDLSQWL